MTIVGIGIDIIEISRIKNIVHRFKNRFALRILSKKEWDEYVLSKNNIFFLAKKFASKEAASKALGTGMSYGINFNQIEYFHDIKGKPKLNFLKNALKKYKKMKCNSSYISISDQKLYVCALVILES